MSAFAEPLALKMPTGFRQTTLVCTEREELEAKASMASSSITGFST